MQARWIDLLIRNVNCTCVWGAIGRKEICYAQSAILHCIACIGEYGIQLYLSQCKIKGQKTTSARSSTMVQSSTSSMRVVIGSNPAQTKLASTIVRSS